MRPLLATLFLTFLGPLPGHAEPVWAYGTHPVLGLSAHVDTGEGALGLVCLGDSGWTMSLRISPELMGKNGTTYLFDNQFDVGSIGKAGPDGYGEKQDSACGMSVKAFREAGALILVDGTVTAIAGRDGGLEITIRNGDKDVAVTSGPDAAARLRGRTIPLTGSARAIGRLLAACPAARAELADDCGI